MKQFAVIGNPIAHSLSPLIHQLFARQCGVELEYTRIKGELGRFADDVRLFFDRGGTGLNITAPFKQQAFRLCDEASVRSQHAQAANILWQKNGKIFADNSDGIGLLMDLRQYIDLKHRNILIIGAGGAVCGILEPLFNESPNQITIVNRSDERAQMLKLQFESFGLLHLSSIDALSVGYHLIIHALSTETECISKMPSVVFEARPFGYDLCYQSDGETSFVQTMRARGLGAVDGLGMLVCQAAESFRIWHDRLPNVSPVIEQLRSGRKE